MRRQWLYVGVLLSIAFGAWSTVGASEMPPIPSTPEDVDVTYILSDISGGPGAMGLPAYFSIATNSPMQGALVAFSYDRNVLAAESIESYIKRDGKEPDYLNLYIWAPPDPGIPRHGCYLGFVWDFLDEGAYFYPAEGEQLASFRFAVAPGAPPGTETTLTFVDDVVLSGPRGPAAPNVFVIQHVGIPPGFENGGVSVTKFANGRVRILEEISIIFLRGDANLDRKVDLADAISILGFLFRAGPSLSCPDTADANDDGVLDIADPISILYTLFGNASTIAAPYPSQGQDPTADLLGLCHY